MKAIKQQGPRTPWTRPEINACLSVYRDFLRKERNGEKYQKAKAIR